MCKFKSTESQTYCMRKLRGILVLTVVASIFLLLVLFIAYFSGFLTGTCCLRPPSQRLKLLGFMCQTGSKHRFMIENLENETVNTKDLVVQIDGSIVQCNWSSSTIEISRIAVCETDFHVNSGNHTVTVTRANDTVQGEDSCS